MELTVNLLHIRAAGSLIETRSIGPPRSLQSATEMTAKIGSWNRLVGLINVIETRSIGLKSSWLIVQAMNIVSHKVSMFIIKLACLSTRIGTWDAHAHVHPHVRCCKRSRSSPKSVRHISSLKLYKNPFTLVFIWAMVPWNKRTSRAVSKVLFSISH